MRLSDVALLAVHEQIVAAVIGAIAVLLVELVRLEADRRARRAGRRRTRAGDRRRG